MSTLHLVSIQPYNYIVPSYSELSQCTEGDVEGYDITQDEVYMRLRTIKPHSAAGPDGITSWMLSIPLQMLSHPP